MINEEIKQKILKKGIIQSESDWNKASVEHLELAQMFLLLSETIEGITPSTEEKIAFLQETQELNDSSELNNVDKVEPNKTFQSNSIRIGVPLEIVPFLRDMYADIKFKNET